jgi:RNA polymerase sigma factor (sigma-70 family)
MSATARRPAPPSAPKLRNITRVCKFIATGPVAKVAVTITASHVPKALLLAGSASVRMGANAAACGGIISTEPPQAVDDPRRCRHPATTRLDCRAVGFLTYVPRKADDISLRRGGVGREASDPLAAFLSKPGKAELLSTWSSRYRGPLLRFFQRRMPDWADREDLVQEVYVKLARRDDLAQIERVDSYLFETAANVLKDWRRKQVTHAANAHDPIDEQVVSVDASAERVLLGRDTVRALVEALSTLPERTQSVFMLYHFEYLTHAEIGARLGIAIRTVEDHMGRANAHLLSRMGDQP